MFVQNINQPRKASKASIKMKKNNIYGIRMIYEVGKKKNSCLRMVPWSEFSNFNIQRAINQQKNQNQTIIFFKSTQISTMSDDEQFDKVDAGSSDCVPCQAGSIKKGGYCMLKGRPCKVTQYSTAKPGKHGSAKATIVGVDIFTNKKYEDGAPTSHNMLVPNVVKTEYEVANIGEDLFVSLILDDGNLKEDLKLNLEDPEQAELKDLYAANADKNQVYFTVVRACGQEKIVAGRVKQ